MPTIESIAPGVMRIEGGTYVFSAPVIHHALIDSGLNPDAAAAVIGRLIMAARAAEDGRAA